MSPSAVAKHPLVPEAAKPEVCRRSHCEIARRTPGPDEDPSIALFITHRSGEHYDEMAFPSAWLEDWRRLVWDDDAKPWIESLHEPWPCPTCGKPR